jgi:hypothetical protein
MRRNQQKIARPIETTEAIRIPSRPAKPGRNSNSGKPIELLKAIDNDAAPPRSVINGAPHLGDRSQDGLSVRGPTIRL